MLADSRLGRAFNPPRRRLSAAPWLAGWLQNRSSGEWCSEGTRTVPPAHSYDVIVKVIEGSDEDGTYSVQPRWKEEVVYSEGSSSITFAAGWGVDPPVLYLPSEAMWDQSTPAWLHGRHVQVVARLKRDSQHVIKFDDQVRSPLD